MTTYTLKRIIYGKPAVGNQRLTHFDVLALSEDVYAADMPAWRALAPLEPMPDGSQAIGVFSGPGDNVIFARAHAQHGTPIYGYTLVPRPAMLELQGNLAPLLALFVAPIPGFAAANTLIPPLELQPRPWSPAERRATFETFLQRYAGGDIGFALALLGAVIDDRALMVEGFTADLTQRLLFVQGLLALLPAFMRGHITFSTSVGPPSIAYPHIVFIETPQETPRYIARYHPNQHPQLIGKFPGGKLPAYSDYLLRLWQDDVAQFLEAIDSLRYAAPDSWKGQHLSQTLETMIAREILDQQVLAGEAVLPQQLEAVLSDGMVTGETRRAYVRALFAHSLQARDDEAAVIVARAMDSDPQLDQLLGIALEDTLATQPDSVYAFVRARLAALGVETRWQQRLKWAALSSLQVAITDGDNETLLNWLKLVAREPAAYGLTEVLRQAILAARLRAHQDGELGKGLVMLAVKRDPVLLDVLLEDQALLAPLPDALAWALRDYRPDAIEECLNVKGRELYLAAMARAAHAGISDVFDAAAVDRIWAMYTNEQAINLPPVYQPEAIVQEWLNRGLGWLEADARETLLTAALASSRDALFYRLVHSLTADPELLPPPLATLILALNRSKRSATDIVEIVGHLVSDGHLTLQDAVNVYVALLNGWEWRKTASPLVEQLARTLAQASALVLPTDALWHLLEQSQESHNDMLARVAARRLSQSLEALEDENELTSGLLKMYDLLLWNPIARQLLMHWWRDFVRGQGLGRLQRLEKALDGKRSLEEARAVVQTAIALRKLLGKRSLRDFAEDVARAFAVLQALAEAFEPSSRHELHFDQATIRAELDARQPELAPQDRTVLANNFKELAQLISGMGDSRSKASLVRRDLDRQLMIGEQTPQSAVDVLKWLAGYLSGAQEREDEEES
ncbi:MAG: hypothetical protein HXY40_02245 [Chloroflexi bacterium]|nr:hypothetical protein [Chloroflexota bacterium]